MCFLVPDPDETDGIPEEASCFSASIGITGSPRYRITISVDCDLARLMASNALGFEEHAIEETKIRHFLLETVNVIGGKFLLMWDHSSGRDLTIPAEEPGLVFDSPSTNIIASLEMYYEGKVFTTRAERFD